MKKFIACILARGGSKGIPKKNIVDLNGFPLIKYSIDAALNCSLVDSLYVSSDSDEILDVCRNYIDEESLILRPANLAEDSSSSLSALRGIILGKKLSEEDNIVLLQPTSPLRNSVHVHKAITQFNETDSRSLISVTEESHHPAKSFTIENDILCPYIHKEFLSMPRQHLQSVYRQNGAIYINKVSDLLSEESFYVDPCTPFLMREIDSVDIDEPLDISLASFFLSKA